MEAIKKEGHWNGEIHNKKKDSTEFISYARISVLRDHDDKIINFLSTQHDITEEKQIKEALLQSEEKYRALAEAAIDGIYIISTEIGFEYVNPAFERISGYKSEEICKKDFNLLSLVHPEDKELVQKRKEAREKRKDIPSIYEFRIVTKEEEIKFVEVNTVPLPSVKGKILGILRDITDRRRAEDEYRKAQERFSGIYNSSKDAIGYANLKGYLLDVNRAFCSLTGYSREEMLNGMRYQDLTPDEYHQFETNTIERILRTGKPEEYEKEYVRKDGSRVPVLLTTFIVRGNNGKPVGLAAIIKDITKSKLTQEKLKMQNLRNKLVLQTALDGFLLLDRKGTILEANKSVADILGYSLEKIVGMNLRDLEAKEDAQEVKKHINKVIRKGFDRFETKFWNKNGKIVELRVSTSFFEQKGNKYFFTFFHDITESNKTEHALREREKELKTKSTNLEELNIALKVLLKKREEDKSELEKSILYNVEELVVPYLEKLKKNGLNKKHGIYIEILENNLNEIISPFSRRMSAKYHNFTPAEIRVADLVRQGKRNKEIAEILNVSPRTITFHRENIRKKLDLRNKKTNLASYLSSLT